MTKLFKVLNYEIHDHYIIFSIFASIILITFIDNVYLTKHNCYILEPDIDCSSISYISAASLNLTNYSYTSASISAYGLDEFRSLQGTQHIECVPGNDTCTVHYDVYNGVVGWGNIFNVVGHMAETLDRTCWGQLAIQGFTPNIYGCPGLPDYVSVLLIWALFILLPYYFVKHTILLYVRGGSKKR